MYARQTQVRAFRYSQAFLDNWEEEEEQLPDFKCLDDPSSKDFWDAATLVFDTSGIEYEPIMIRDAFVNFIYNAMHIPFRDKSFTVTLSNMKSYPNLLCRRFVNVGMLHVADLKYFGLYRHVCSWCGEQVLREGGDAYLVAWAELVDLKDIG